MDSISSVLSGDFNQQIIYRGEGNSSIVIALKDRSKVVRLLKKDGKIMKFSQDNHTTLHPMSSIKFIHLVMKPLTDSFLSGSTRLVHLKSELINILSKKVEAERPLHRLDKTLHLDDQYALVMDDLCALPQTLLSRLNPQIDLCGPTISVEIKPKQGFLPIQRNVTNSATNDQILAQFKDSCLYGSVQFLKLARYRIENISDYCPVNLFSGCPIKMRSALAGLIKNPQNNFRIFKDLVLAYGEANCAKVNVLFQGFFPNDDQKIRLCQEYEQQLIELIIQALLSQPHQYKDGRDELFETDSNTHADENNHLIQDNRTCNRHKLKSVCIRCDAIKTTKKAKIDSDAIAVDHRLPEDCVLANVLRAQQLDTIGAQEACDMLDWLLVNSSSNDVLGELSKPQVPRGFGSTCRLSDETKEQYYFRKVWEFLVSLTAKDCSIIITMRRIAPGRYDDLWRRQPSLECSMLLDKRTGAHYVFSVGIADLDQKMPLKIHRICDHINQTIKQLVKHDRSRKNL